jgi:transposase-like protein
MLSIHPQARTTPAVRQEIARSPEPTGVLAKRFGVSTETIRKWRQRGADDCKDHSSRPHKLPWKATEEERAIVWDPSREGYNDRGEAGPRVAGNPINEDD